MQEPHDMQLHQRLQDGIDSVAVELDHRFRERLCRLVEREMNEKYRRREDPEDVVQSVFRTFFRRLPSGKYGCQHDGALWRLLQRITRTKIKKHVEHHTAKGRDIDREEGEADEQVPAGTPSSPEARLLGDVLEKVLQQQEPPIAEIFMTQLYGYTLSEVIEIILHELESPYPEILQLRLQGKTQHEIAAQLGIGREAVRFRLERIQQRLARLLKDPDDRSDAAIDASCATSDDN